MNKVLIDCRDCGGGGCRKCRDKGTRLVAPSRPAGLRIPRDPGAFEAAREQCPCYEGFSINDGVMQCSHADARGEWCEVESCPALTPNVEFSGGAPLHGAASAGTQGYASEDEK